MAKGLFRRCVTGCAGAAGAALLLSVAPVAAQEEVAGDQAYAAAITAVLDQAIAEHTVFLNCTATSGEQHNMLVKSWVEAVVETGQLLFEIGFETGYVADFANRAGLANMMMYDETLLTVTAFCNANAGWDRQLYTLTYTLLPGAVEEVPVPEIVAPDDGKTLTPGKLDSGF